MSVSRFRRPGATPDRPFVAALALDPENLPRALAAMGFDARVACLRRGDIAWWTPDYFRLPNTDLLRARCGEAQVARFLASRRDQLARINRGLADSPVYVMHRVEPDTVICVDATAGEWRSPSNAVRGDNIVALASLMWRTNLAAACHRLARACGLAEAPLADAG